MTPLRDISFTEHILLCAANPRYPATPGTAVATGPTPRAPLQRCAHRHGLRYGDGCARTEHWLATR